jgi:glutathione S-transferase
MKPVITAFRNSPDGGNGHARDMRVRWALEEVGQPYDVRLMTFDELKAPSHQGIHPFGKIPTYQTRDLVMFESGAIVLHIARENAGLLPPDANAHARAVVWLFAALNTIEPPIIEREAFMLQERDKAWYAERLHMLDNAVRQRLGELSDYLGSADWLEGEFTVGDLMMVMVLRRLEDGPNLLTGFPNLLAYVARGENRKAFKRAFDAQRAVYNKSSAKA